jgi:NAD-dependent dihydropyrimidine dehydrogenase PreA subunit
MPETKPDKGIVKTNRDECKGCGLCVEACTPKVLRLDEHLNRYGYHPAVYIGHGCTACGLCFYVCPEPGGITVYRRRVVPAASASVRETVTA